MRYRDLIQINTDLNQDTLWFRGSEYGLPSNALGGVFTKPDDRLPDAVNGLFEHTNRIYRLTRSYQFRISRTYSGMSNWGFGVYFSNRLDWAKRYGSTIVVAAVDPNVILTINDMDFSGRVDGTTGGELAKIVNAVSDSWDDQAKIMFGAVKKIKKDAKALFVRTSEEGDGQMCVFNKAFATPLYGFDLKS